VLGIHAALRDCSRPSTIASGGSIVGTAQRIL